MARPRKCQSRWRPSTAEANNVTVDVAVEDSKGHFIPKLDKSYFPRFLRTMFRSSSPGYSNGGSAHDPIAMVVEFSNRFQSFYSRTWFQTLQAAYGFAGMLRPDDYLAIIAYDLRPEMLTDFTVDRGPDFRKH